MSAAVVPAPDDRRTCAHLVVTDRIEGWLTTPLHGPGLQGLPADFTLADLQMADRIDELTFELRVGTGHGKAEKRLHGRLRGGCDCTTRCTVASGAGVATTS